LGLSLMYNVTGVSFAVAGELTPLIAAILMPLSSVTVVGFVTLATTLTARRLWRKGAN
jgi:P-type Cu+ transporter